MEVRAVVRPRRRRAGRQITVDGGGGAPYVEIRVSGCWGGGLVVCGCRGCRGGGGPAAGGAEVSHVRATLR
jgi:hypothetical protein